jgi:hypothetical protein
MKSEISISTSITCVSVFRPNSHADTQIPTSNFGALYQRKISLKRNIDDPRSIGIYSALVPTFEISGVGSEILRWGQKKLNPSLIDNIVGRCLANISQLKSDSGSISHQIFGWIAMRAGHELRPLTRPKYFGAHICSMGGGGSSNGLPPDYEACDESDDYKHPFRGSIPFWLPALSAFRFCCGAAAIILVGGWEPINVNAGLSILFYVAGALLGFAPLWKTNNCDQNYYCGDKDWFHSTNTVPYKYLSTPHRNPLGPPC